MINERTLRDQAEKLRLIAVLLNILDAVSRIKVADGPEIEALERELGKAKSLLQELGVKL